MGCDFLVIVCSCQNKGVDSLSLYSLISNFDQVMARTSENLKRGTDVSSIQRTPRRNEGKSLSKKELQRQLKYTKQELEEEKRCKNEAYYFILSDGSFRKFAEFHKKYKANLDYHGACLAQLYLDSFTKK